MKADLKRHQRFDYSASVILHLSNSTCTILSVGGDGSAVATSAACPNPTLGAGAFEVSIPIGKAVVLLGEGNKPQILRHEEGTLHVESDTSCYQVSTVRGPKLPRIGSKKKLASINSDQLVHGLDLAIAFFPGKRDGGNIAIIPGALRVNSLDCVLEIAVDLKGFELDLPLPKLKQLRAALTSLPPMIDIHDLDSHYAFEGAETTVMLSKKPEARRFPGLDTTHLAQFEMRLTLNPVSELMKEVVIDGQPVQVTAVLQNNPPQLRYFYLGRRGTNRLEVVAESPVVEVLLNPGELPEFTAHVDARKLGWALAQSDDGSIVYRSLNNGYAELSYKVDGRACKVLMAQQRADKTGRLNTGRRR